MKLEIGYHHPVTIRRHLRHAEGVPEMKIVYLSDLHFCRWSRQTMRQIIDGVDSIQPDMILLGGDYADSAKGLICFQEMMSAIAGAPHILAIPGNHDWWCRRGIRRIVENAGGVWIDDSSAFCRMGNSFVRVDSRGAMNTVSPYDKSGLSILCLHQPIDVRHVAPCYDLIFAGHLHGGQVVLWENAAALFPGRLVYRWNRTTVVYGNCQYFIGKGLGDTLPIRYNCKKEIVLVDITNPLIQTPIS